MTIAKDSPVNQLKLTDRREYTTFISECLILVTARNRLARKQKAERPYHDENTAVVRSIRRIVPLAQSLYPFLPGEHGQRLVRKGVNPIYITHDGTVWMAGHMIAWKE
jgi:hypothetical protein